MDPVRGWKIMWFCKPLWSFEHWKVAIFWYHCQRIGVMGQVQCEGKKYYDLEVNLCHLVKVSSRLWRYGQKAQKGNWHLWCKFVFHQSGLQLKPWRSMNLRRECGEKRKRLVISSHLFLFLSLNMATTGVFLAWQNQVKRLSRRIKS